VSLAMRGLQRVLVVFLLMAVCTCIDVILEDHVGDSVLSDPGQVAPKVGDKDAVPLFADPYATGQVPPTQRASDHCVEFWDVHGDDGGR